MLLPWQVFDDEVRPDCGQRFGLAISGQGSASWVVQTKRREVEVAADGSVLVRLVGKHRRLLLQIRCSPWPTSTRRRAAAGGGGGVVRVDPKPDPVTCDGSGYLRVSLGTLQHVGPVLISVLGRNLAGVCLKFSATAALISRTPPPLPPPLPASPPPYVYGRPATNHDAPAFQESIRFAAQARQLAQYKTLSAFTATTAVSQDHLRRASGRIVGFFEPVMPLDGGGDLSAVVDPADVVVDGFIFHCSETPFSTPHTCGSDSACSSVSYKRRCLPAQQHHAPLQPTAQRRTTLLALGKRRVRRRTTRPALQRPTLSWPSQPAAPVFFGGITAAQSSVALQSQGWPSIRPVETASKTTSKTSNQSRRIALYVLRHRFTLRHPFFEVQWSKAPLQTWEAPSTFFLSLQEMEVFPSYLAYVKRTFPRSLCRSIRTYLLAPLSRKYDRDWYLRLPDNLLSKDQRFYRRHTTLYQK